MSEERWADCILVVRSTCGLVSIDLRRWSGVRVRERREGGEREDACEKWGMRGRSSEFGLVRQRQEGKGS